MSGLLPSTKLACIDPARVHEIWPHVASRLRSAITRTGLSAFADIERDILLGKALLWIAASGEGSDVTIDAVASTSLQKTDAGTVCVITACAGKDMARWLSLIADIEAYAKAERCTCMRIYGRKGWLRVLEGYRPTHIVMDKNLS